uniref:precorrin-4 C(11)-methyltransferase n=1 Tax=Prevotella heparinolytica TaxID=28113 RepID=UPI0035A12FE4
VSPQVPRFTETPMICYVPRALHLGIGLARQAGPTREVLTAIEETLKEQGIVPAAIASISTIDAKSEEPVVKALQKEYTVNFHTAEELASMEVPHPSPTVMKHMGTASVCEAAALLTAANSQLLLPKVKGANYTVAAAIDGGMMRRGHIEIVGAGPGDPELISVRGRRLLEKADLILYAGSLVPRELTHCAKPGATVLSSASMDLKEQFRVMKTFYDKGLFIVRLHTGDPCIYGAIQEQMNYFDQHGMSYHITPGISSFQAAAAALKSQFTIPEKVQSIILTRGEGRTPMPEREKLHLMARSQSTMCIFLSAGIAEQVQEELLQEYPESTPVAVCYHLTWKDERIFRGELKDLAKIVKENELTLTTLIVVGEAIDNREGLSRLYAHEFKHLFRK